MKEIRSEIYFSVFVFFVLTILFSVVIFFMTHILFSPHDAHKHEQDHEHIYIEPQEFARSDDQDLYSASESIAKNPISFRYIPDDLVDRSEAYGNALATFLYQDTLYAQIEDLSVEIHELAYKVRGNMRSKTLRLFGIFNMEVGEFLSVGIHEFAHYFDIYILKKSVFRDVSEYFYEISWESTKVMQAGQEQGDFVSGYAMTNKYEDFAESYTYFVLHNNDFRIKSAQSDILRAKYDFFRRFVFREEEFFKTDFSVGNKIEKYYWDITKIGIDVKKLLRYLEK
ncbi:putative zinc-binding metallopeptidase [Candidatus Gracilibacteria bacterium]|nr:putative zinc-binding metallopeptidase [Candidatus Gracilibacteria bacterium]